MSSKSTHFLRSQMEESRLIRLEEKEIRFSKIWFLLKTLKWFIALIIGIIALFLWGCEPKVITITKYVKVEVPIKCTIDIPLKPKPGSDAVEMNFSILEYSKKLESALKACR